MKVGPLQRRFQESRGAAAAAAVSHRHLKMPDTFLVLSVVIVVAPIAETDGGLDPGVDHRTLEPAFRNIERAPLAAYG